MPVELILGWGKNNLGVQLGLWWALWELKVGTQMADECMAWGDSGVGRHGKATYVEIRAQKCVPNRLRCHLPNPLRQWFFLVGVLGFSNSKSENGNHTIGKLSSSRVS
jgi:hypothetical protein